MKYRLSVMGLLFSQIMCFSDRADAGNYYASTSGSGSDCSSVSPCTMTTGAGRLNAGDTLLLQDGTYYDISVLLTKNGAQGTPIKIMAANPGAVQLTRFHAKITGSYWILEGFKIDGVSNGEAGVLLVDNGDWNIFRNNKFSGGSGGATIAILTNGDNNLIEQNSFESEKTYHAVYIDNSRGNKVRYNRFLYRRSGSAIFDGNGGDSPNTTFDHNYIGGGIDWQYGEMIGNKSNDFVLTNNYFTQNGPGGVVLRVFDRSRVECNIFMNNRGISLNGDHHVVRNNYLEGNSKKTATYTPDYYPAALFIDAGDWLSSEYYPGFDGYYEAATNALIENNTVVDWAGPEISIGEAYGSTRCRGGDNKCFKLDNPPSNLTMRNNIISDPANTSPGMPVIKDVASPGAVWSGNVVNSPMPGNLPSSGVTLADPIMQRLADGLYHSAAFPSFGFQASQCSPPRQPSDVGPTWDGGSTTPEPTPAPTPSSNLPGYLGCYSDEAIRALPVELNSSYSNTVEDCIALAKTQGLAFAALQYGGQCFGGQVLGYTKVSDGECNMVCRGNASEICGGTWRNSIYPTGIQPTPSPDAAAPNVSIGAPSNGSTVSRYL